MRKVLLLLLAVVPPAVRAAETTVADAQDNMWTVLDTYCRNHGGVLMLRASTAARPLRLRLDSIDPRTIHRDAGGRFIVLAQMSEVRGGGRRDAEFVVDMSGDSWGVEEVRLISRSLARRRLAEYAATSTRQRAADPAAASEASAPADDDASDDDRPRLPDFDLDTVDGDEPVGLATCPEDECLTAYVAPWCTVCQETTPRMLALRAYLRTRRVPMRFVVGDADSGLCEEYAKEFGPDTMLDPDSDWEQHSFPHFYLTDRHGIILRESPGGLESDRPEINAAMVGISPAGAAMHVIAVPGKR